MKTVAAFLLLIVCAAVVPKPARAQGPVDENILQDPTPSKDFDGTYDYTVQLTRSGRKEQNTAQGAFVIRNGRIQVPGGLFQGYVDRFGKIVFKGPCPAASLQGRATTFWGILNQNMDSVGQWDSGNGVTGLWWIRNRRK